MIFSTLHLNIVGVSIVLFSYGCTQDVSSHYNSSPSIRNQTSDTAKKQ